MITIIICHHQGRILLRNSVESLLKSKDVEFEIIIATSDETLIEFPKTKVIQIKGGPAHKRNIAARYAMGAYIAFFDDDTEATPTSVSEMVKVLEEYPVIGMVFGKLKNMEFRNRFDEAGSYLTHTGFLWARAESGIEDKGQFEIMVPILSGKSAACLIRRKLFWEVGGFDSSYEILGEETDLAWRVWLVGYKVFYVPKSVTYHAFGTSYKPEGFYVAKRIFYNGSRNYLIMLYTNLGKKKWIFPVCFQLLIWTLAAIGMFIRGKIEASYWIFRGIGYFLLNIRNIWLKRFNVQKKMRKISDKDLMSFILRNPPISYYMKRFFHYILRARHG